MNSSAGEFKHSIYSRNLPFFGIGSDAYFCSVLVDNLFILMLTFTSTKKLYKSMVAKQRCKQFCNSSMTLKNILEYFNIFALLSFISKVIILIFYCFIVYWPIYFFSKKFSREKFARCLNFGQIRENSALETRKILHSRKFIQSNFFSNSDLRK